jgi:hypothetical protein
MLVSAHAGVRYLCSNLTKKQIMSTKLNKQPTHTKFQENPLGMSFYVSRSWTDRRTERRKEGQKDRLTDGKFENVMIRFLQPLLSTHSQ